MSEETQNSQDPQSTPSNHEENTQANVPESSLDQSQMNQLDISRISRSVEKIKGELAKVIIGQEEMIEFSLAALFVGGHVLLEGVPGIAKTLTAKLLAQTIDARFSRIQFTPDMMPTDVVGTSVFNMKDSEFRFAEGPIFANLVLIDEINRSPAKTQAALFEVMEEKQVTVDGTTYKMEFPFFVMATQNPIEQEGTYKLPEAQLDRFLYRIKMDYPSAEEEFSILSRFKSDFDQSITEEVRSVFSKEDLRTCRDLIERIVVSDDILKYISRIVTDTRNNGDLFLGASPRASLAIMRSAKAIAAMRGRDFVTPEDVQQMAYPVLNHRIILTPEREMDGSEVEDVIGEIIAKIEVPR